MGPRQDRGGVCTHRQSMRSEEHTSELQSHLNLVCRLLLEKNKPKAKYHQHHLTGGPREHRHGGRSPRPHAESSFCVSCSRSPVSPARAVLCCFFLKIRPPAEFPLFPPPPVFPC